MPLPYGIDITRVGDWDEAYNVYAALGHWPIESGDGILAGTVTIEPWETEVQLVWTPAASGDWKFSAEPVRWGQTGPLGRLT